MWSNKSPRAGVFPSGATHLMPPRRKRSAETRTLSGEAAERDLTTVAIRLRKIAFAFTHVA
jgi:hypothetical protein